jgi:thiamine kinase-like enzyme
VSGVQQLQAHCAQASRPSQHLIAFDGHPGNFVVQADGKAMLVDLEKCRYSYPGLDLAHATLYTSTTWDVDTHAVLSLAQVAQTYATWEQAMGHEHRSARAWHVPLRRAMWLWSLTWCAKWQALSGRSSAAQGDGEDWSAERSTTTLIAHVQERVHHYLSADVVAGCLNEFTTLEAM